MKSKLILLGSMFATLVSSAQTNSPATTNPPPQTAEQVLAAQKEAVRKAMPQYYTIEQDPVDDTKTISLINYEVLEDVDGANLKLDVVAFIHPPKKLPPKISLHLISHSSEWRFLDDHDFTIRFGDQKLSPGDLAYSNKVLDDATVVEHVWPDFTLEQFHQIAWANTVYFKLGYKNYAIPYQTRQKWKLLWKYFDLMKTDSDSDLKKAIQ
jgi:hypothetical protein